MALVGLGIGCVPRLPPGPAPAPGSAGEGASEGGSVPLLPLVRQRVLEAQVLAARGEVAAARERLERAKGLWPGGAGWLEAEAAGWPPSDEEQEVPPAVLQPPPSRSLPEAVLSEDDPVALLRLAEALHAPAVPAPSPALILLAELRVAVRGGGAGRAGCLARAAAALGDQARLSRLAEVVPAAGPGCSGGAGPARDEAGEAGGYPGENSGGAPLHGVPETVAPAWAAYRAGRPREARLLVDRAYRESGHSEDVLVWLRLIQGVPGETALWGAP